MFDKLYEYYVNFRTIRAAYQLGFFIYWAHWAKGGLDATPAEVTWLVFGWLPAIFWPIQFIATIVDVGGAKSVLPLPELWIPALRIPLGDFTLIVPWAVLLIAGFLGVLFWFDVKAYFAIKNGDEAKQSPAAATT